MEDGPQRRHENGQAAPDDIERASCVWTLDPTLEVLSTHRRIRVVAQHIDCEVAEEV